jgi:hypothetical protein
MGHRAARASRDRGTGERFIVEHVDSSCDQLMSLNTSRAREYLERATIPRNDSQLLQRGHATQN